MSDDKAVDVIQQWERLEAEWAVFRTHSQECADFMLPNRNDYIATRAPGSKRMNKVFDSTPIWANEQFAAGIHGLLTSPTLPWFSLWSDDDRLNNIPRVRAWLQAAGDHLYGIFNSSRHNFASMSHELYLDLGHIGTGVMAVLESPRSGTLFSTRHMKECVFAENEEDRVDTLIRNWEWTAKQAVQSWGKAAGEKVITALDKTPDKKFRFLHAARPRRIRDAQRRDNRNKPVESVYVSLEDRTVISESGFDEFPYLTPRFSKVTGETHGRGPGMTVLPDVKMLNEMAKTVLKAAQKVVDPPLMLPDDGFMMPIKTTPGGLNYYRAGMRPTDRIAPIETKGDIQLGVEMLNALRQQIMRGFYLDIMTMPPSNPKDLAADGKGVTATFTLQQRDTAMRMLSPMLARLQSEDLGPLIDRCFAMEWRKSVALRFGRGSPFPPPPPELSGVPLRVEYVSPIALAQKGAQLDAVDRLIARQLSLRQVDPQSPIVLDAEGIMRLTSSDTNAPAQALKTPERMAQEAQQAAEASAALNNHAALANVAGAAKDGSAAIKNLADAHASAQGAGQLAEAA